MTFGQMFGSSERPVLTFGQMFGSAERGRTHVQSASISSPEAMFQVSISFDFKSRGYVLRWFQFCLFVRRAVSFHGGIPPLMFASPRSCESANKTPSSGAIFCGGFSFVFLYAPLFYTVVFPSHISITSDCSLLL